MKKNFFIILLVLLLVAPTVLAVPPFQSGDVTQLQVVVPKPEYMLLDHTFSFHVHVYDTAGLLLDNSTTSCEIHVYNTTGNHVIDDVMLFDTNGEDFYYTLTGADYVTEKGLFPFIVWCYQEAIGGYYSGDLEINDATGIGITEDTTQGISISLFILVATLLFFLLPRLYGTFSENPIVNLVITRCCYVIGFYLMVMNAGLISSMASNAGYGTTEIFMYLWLFGVGGYLLMFITGIKTIFDVVGLYTKMAKERRGL